MIKVKPLYYYMDVVENVVYTYLLDLLERFISARALTYVIHKTEK